MDSGYAVAMPSYTLCPEVRIADIVREVGAAIASVAELIGGPIFLTGHSAGGHLVTRMISATSPLPAAVQNRVGHTVSISGVHDLRPLMNTSMNAELRIDSAEAQAESPALLAPMRGARLTCWVGARGAFRIHPAECFACQYLDRSWRGNGRGRGAGPPSFQRHRRLDGPSASPDPHIVDSIGRCAECRFG